MSMERRSLYNFNKNDKYKIELCKEGFVLCNPDPGLKLHCINFQT